MNIKNILQKYFGYSSIRSGGRDGYDGEEELKLIVAEL